MVEITAKALRFVRLAAEQLAGFAGSAQIGVIRREEAWCGGRSPDGSVRRVADISEETAEFCLAVFTACLADRAMFSTLDWDGNDHVFMTAVSRSLERQLSSMPARLS